MVILQDMAGHEVLAHSVSPTAPQKASGNPKAGHRKQALNFYFFFRFRAKITTITATSTINAAPPRMTGR